MHIRCSCMDKIHSLQKERKKKEADNLIRISYYVDHGNGMDCYDACFTLGGGTAALLSGSSILYPDYEILDNGSLHFTVKLIYRSLVIEKESDVVETKVITLDKGAHLNHTRLYYSSLSVSRLLAAGIVIHSQHPDGQLLARRKSI